MFLALILFVLKRALTPSSDLEPSPIEPEPAFATSGGEAPPKSDSTLLTSFERPSPAHPAMPSTLSVSLPRPAVVVQSNVRPGIRLALLIAVAACLLTFGVNAFWRESYTGDEGFYGVTAQNMLHAPSYWLRPSYFPLGDFMADRDGFAHPPFNSYFYAAGLWLSRGSLVGPEVVNLLALAALLYFSYRLLARVDVTAAAVGVALLAASPALTGYYSMLEAEPLLVTFGVMGLYGCLRSGFERHRRLGLFAGGLCIGMAFALKLWLVGPVVLAAGMALCLNAWGSGRPWRTYVAPGLLFCAGVALPSALHLAAIAFFYPQDLSFWLRNIYFGVFTHAGISGSKVAGDAIPANWIHPVWYYGAALYRDDFFLLPPIAFGFTAAFRENRRLRNLLLVLGAGIAGLVPLSLLKVKEPLYVLTCAVFLYLFAAPCFAAAVRRIAREGELDWTGRWIGMPLVIGMLLVVPAACALGVMPDKITLPFVIAHTVVYLLFIGAVLGSTMLKAPRLAMRTLFAGCAAAVVGVFAWNVATRVPRDVDIVRLAKPYLEANAPGEMSFFGSNFKCYQYYSFAKGCYWHDLDLKKSPDALLAAPEYRHVRAFIMSAEDWERTENADWVHWLQVNAVDKTPELDRDLGTVTGYHLFVRNPAIARIAAR